ncbi:MAG TPA: peptidylprolyl isomerase [Ignavibacteriaceae bacterium]|nr:MAG: putative bifunctional phosphatase/peptidyl-prolyl cis-trans isomerase [Ignavibacteria bacterium ADurb.Bin266]HQI41058.1 peptidylprolyl isomerase [Ignavibacteriaceae bacterium]
MKVLISFIVLSNFLFAQYDSTMYDLIKTTYERSFDKNIISGYLHSNDEREVRAAILSIAQSDTTFVPDLIKLDLDKYGKDIFFALGQIGSCKQSLNFLWTSTHLSVSADLTPNILFAIGKIGNQDDLQKLIQFYKSFNKTFFPYEGIADAILQFQIRGIMDEEAISILETEITNPLSTKNRIKSALFALARYRNNSLSKETIKELLISDFAKKDDQFLTFVLMNINNKNCFDITEKDLSYILNSEAFLTKIQLLKVLHLLGTNPVSFPNENIRLYLKFLNDNNPNVFLQSATSIKNIKPFLNDSIKEFLIENIDNFLFDTIKQNSIKGELFLSRFDLFGDYENHKLLLNELHLSNKYKYQFYAKNPDENEAFRILYDSYFSTSELLDQINILPLILEFKDTFSESSELKQIVTSALQSSFPPLISIAADEIGLDFISENRDELKDIILNQIKNHKNNSDYLEAVMSLVNLAEKIDSGFYFEIIKNASSSKLHSIRKFAANKTNEHNIGFKELDKFDDIWANAFKYKQAEIKTTKGNIVIELYSDIALVSVANFCMLAKENFYNGIMFHRVVPSFVIQAGDPTATGWGGPGYNIVSEFSDNSFNTGYVGMASAGKDTESSQFFIMQDSYPHLNRRYTLFGKVINGLDVVYRITENDNILGIELK